MKRSELVPQQCEKTLIRWKIFNCVYTLLYMYHLESLFNYFQLSFILALFEPS